MKALLYQGNMVPLSALPTRSKRIQGVIFRASLVAGVAGMLSVLTANPIRSSTMGFLSGFTFKGFSVFRYQHKVTDLKSVFSSPRWTVFGGSFSPTQLVISHQFSTFAHFPAWSWIHRLFKKQKHL